MAINHQILGEPGRDNALLVTVESGQSQHRLLFDCGEGCLSKIPISQIQAIEAVIFSHFHIDHIAGFDTYRGDCFTVRSYTLNHGTSCLAYTVREDDHQNVDTVVLGELGLQPEPWLKAVKDVDGVNEETPIDIAEEDYTVGALRRRLVISSPGDSIACVTDFFLPTEADEDRLVRFLTGCQTLVCENNYRDDDADLARKNYHMTSSDVARLADRVGPARFVLFHVSDRYDAQEWQEQLAEVRGQFDRADFPQEWGIE